MLTEFLEVCERAARAGGQVLMELLGRVAPQSKGARDLVTEADFASQATIQRIVLGAFPGHRFLGEETAASAGGAPRAETASADFRWIVDPIDGTMNYVRNMPGYAVSVGLERAGELLVGTVFDPSSGECFTAARGRGAVLNGKPIRASRCTRIGEALIGASFAAHVERGSVEVRQFVEVLHESQGVRRIGSAALNLCYVACGRMDGYYTGAVKTWDVAAGALLIREAGGILTGIDGQPFQLDQPHLACASTRELHRELLTVLARAAARRGDVL